MPKLIVVALAILLPGCASKPREQVYEANGFRFVPPPGWSERARNDDSPGGSTQDRLLVQYKRLTAGHPAWLRVSVADVPSSVDLGKCLTNRSPGKGWRQSGRVESYEVNGLPVARISMAGKWQGKDYDREIVAARRGEQVYFFTATYPASDEQAREQVRRAIAAAKWRQTTTDVASR